jgi:hypothetical protein
MNYENILEFAEKGYDAKAIVELLESNNIGYEVLDADNLMDDNEGNFNIIIDGMGEGYSVLFYNGKYQF